jgi:hypothetical protein
VGSQSYLRSRYEMDSKAIINKVKKIFNSWKGLLFKRWFS